jgi:four helix bundle protein
LRQLVLLSFLARKENLTMKQSSHNFLPHHRLPAYGVALELLRAVRAANITDRKLKDEALRAAKGACLNIAEGAARATRADRARAYVIARGEAAEACAAVEIAVEGGEARAQAWPAVLALGGRLVGMLSRLAG